MNDSRDLKAIAEACQQHQPLRFMRSHGALYIRNDNGIVFDVHQNRSFPDLMAQNKDYADLVLAANPAAVLALIAEIERLQLDNSSLRGSCARLGAEHASMARNFKKANRMQYEARSERDQLKAENEALVAAAQALRDEWRKDQADAERYRWLRVKQTFIWLIQDWFPRNNVLTDVDAEIDGAMGKGEQS
ncbi:hypothetical protein L9Z73_03520 [Pseudomonas sp. TNT11]|uniref:Chromosome partitioning protein ParA n=1 Tax=Pseudomonas emilianonis TaxID=2915812 RepID=A0ABT0ECM2_9PSED|nr:hypothetical protein [Pseudomonas emilianonis]MCK1783463.1 hypothetical protein [Pseudomonas emilianonis]